MISSKTGSNQEKLEMKLTSVHKHKFISQASCFSPGHEANIQLDTLPFLPCWTHS